MKALIVEDEPMASARLARTITENFGDVQVTGITESVRSTVEWLKANPAPDIVFMDVELTDGDCFEIFRQVEFRSKIIMTTAYDTYAIKAFEAGSIDYLLKPISLEALTRAISRCRERQDRQDVSKLLEAIAAPKHYKTRFVVHVGDNIIPVESGEVACFYSSAKSNFLVTYKGKRYLIDSTMDSLVSCLDPDAFFRISRGCIVARHAIERVSRHLNGRLKITVEPPLDEELFVSRARVDDFLAWLE